MLNAKVIKSLWKVDSGYNSAYSFSNAFLSNKKIKKRQTRQKLNLDLLARLDNRQKWCWIWKCQFVLAVLFIVLKQRSECLNDPYFCKLSQKPSFLGISISSSRFHLSHPCQKRCQLVALRWNVIKSIFFFSKAPTLFSPEKVCSKCFTITIWSEKLLISSNENGLTWTVDMLN